MNVIIIGTGNVATVLGKRIKTAGHTILQVYGRTLIHAQNLSATLDASHCNDLSLLNTTADVYLLAVSDSAIYQVAALLRAGNGVVAHTSGSVPAEVLKLCSPQYGVLYPLQSLRAELDPLAEIPLLINGNNEYSKKRIADFANGISPQVATVSDEERAKLHVAAVMASNFTNHLYAAADYYCKNENLDFSLLYPLIEETARRVRSFHPALMQTGPAARNDLETVSKHLQLLEVYPSLREIYMLLTNSILEKDNFAIPPAGTGTL